MCFPQRKINSRIQAETAHNRAGMIHKTIIQKQQMKPIFRCCNKSKGGKS